MTFRPIGRNVPGHRPKRPWAYRPKRGSHRPKREMGRNVTKPILFMILYTPTSALRVEVRQVPSNVWSNVWSNAWSYGRFWSNPVAVCSLFKIERGAVFICFKSHFGARKMRFKTNDFNCIERSKINLPLKGVTSHPALDNCLWVG